MKLVGNGSKATLLIFVFIVLLCLFAWRCSSAADRPLEVDLRGGMSFGPGGQGPVLGLDLHFPQGNAVDLYAGTLLWGQTQYAPTNWDWHAGFRTCRWSVCASLGAAYLQAADRIDGSHTNFNLGLSWLIGWHRLASVDFAHLSNAGSVAPNLGRNAALVSMRLQ